MEIGIASLIHASVTLKLINLMKFAVFGHFLPAKKRNFYRILIYSTEKFTNLENDIHTDF